MIYIKKIRVNPSTAKIGERYYTYSLHTYNLLSILRPTLSEIRYRSERVTYRNMREKILEEIFYNDSRILIMKYLTATLNWQKAGL